MSEIRRAWIRLLIWTLHVPDCADARGADGSVDGVSGRITNLVLS